MESNGCRLWTERDDEEGNLTYKYHSLHFIFLNSLSTLSFSQLSQHSFSQLSFSQLSLSLNSLNTLFLNSLSLNSVFLSTLSFSQLSFSQLSLNSVFLSTLSFSQLSLSLNSLFLSTLSFSQLSLSLNSLSVDNRFLSLRLLVMDYRLVFMKVLSEDDIRESTVTSGSLDFHPNHGGTFQYSVPQLEWQAIMENAEQQHFSLQIMLVTELDTRPTQVLLSRLHNTIFNIKIPVPSELRDREDSTFAVRWPVEVFHRRSAQGRLVLKLSTAFNPPTVPTLPVHSDEPFVVKKVNLQSCVIVDGSISIPMTESKYFKFCSYKPNYLECWSPIVMQVLERTDAGLVDGELGSFCFCHINDRSLNRFWSDEKLVYLLKLFLPRSYDAILGRGLDSKLPFYLTLTFYWVHGEIAMTLDE